jgi:hypothetical protein
LEEEFPRSAGIGQKKCSELRLGIRGPKKEPSPEDRKIFLEIREDSGAGGEGHAYTALYIVLLTTLDET